MFIRGYMKELLAIIAVILTQVSWVSFASAAPQSVRTTRVCETTSYQMEYTKCYLSIELCRYCNVAPDGKVFGCSEPFIASSHVDCDDPILPEGLDYLEPEAIY